MRTDQYRCRTTAARPSLSSSRAKYRVPLSPHGVMCMPMCGCAMAEIQKKERRNDNAGRIKKFLCGKFFSPTENDRTPVFSASARQSRAPKERKKTDRPREGWEDGTPPPHRDLRIGVFRCQRR